VEWILVMVFHGSHKEQFKEHLNVARGGEAGSDHLPNRYGSISFPGEFHITKDNTKLLLFEFVNIMLLL
jgi:hypothetical protein